MASYDTCPWESGIGDVGGTDNPPGFISDADRVAMSQAMQSMADALYDRAGLTAEERGTYIRWWKAIRSGRCDVIFRDDPALEEQGSAIHKRVEAVL